MPCKAFGLICLGLAGLVGFTRLLGLATRSLVPVAYKGLGDRNCSRSWSFGVYSAVNKMNSATADRNWLFPNMLCSSLYTVLLQVV